MVKRKKRKRSDKDGERKRKNILEERRKKMILFFFYDFEASKVSKMTLYFNLDAKNYSNSIIDITLFYGVGC